MAPIQRTGVDLVAPVSIQAPSAFTCRTANRSGMSRSPLELSATSPRAPEYASAAAGIAAFRFAAVFSRPASTFDLIALPSTNSASYAAYS